MSPARENHLCHL